MCIRLILIIINNIINSIILNINVITLLTRKCNNTKINNVAYSAIIYHCITALLVYIIFIIIVIILTSIITVILLLFFLLNSLNSVRFLLSLTIDNDS